ncbi:hypothetical protein V8E54_007117 [Elaphomyces granulatus]
METPPEQEFSELNRRLHSPTQMLSKMALHSRTHAHGQKTDDPQLNQQIVPQAMELLVKQLHLAKDELRVSPCSGSFMSIHAPHFERPNRLTLPPPPATPGPAIFPPHVVVTRGRPSRPRNDHSTRHSPSQFEVTAVATSTVASSANAATNVIADISTEPANLQEVGDEFVDIDNILFDEALEELDLSGVQGAVPPPSAITVIVSVCHAPVTSEPNDGDPKACPDPAPSAAIVEFLLYDTQRLELEECAVYSLVQSTAVRHHSTAIATATATATTTAAMTAAVTTTATAPTAATATAATAAAPATVPATARKRGRPKGAKDKEPRKRRPKATGGGDTAATSN